MLLHTKLTTCYVVGSVVRCNWRVIDESRRVTDELQNVLEISYRLVTNECRRVTDLL